MDIDTRDAVFSAVREATSAAYGERLISLAVFGSWARGTATPASDLDLLVVAEPLPPSRMKRVREFRLVADATQAVRSRVWSEQHAEVELSPVFKTPVELAAGSPLYLDMTLWRVVLFDRGGVLATFLEGLRGRTQALGSRRVPFKGAYFGTTSLTSSRVRWSSYDDQRSRCGLLSQMRRERQGERFDDRLKPFLRGRVSLPPPARWQPVATRADAVSRGPLASGAAVQ